MNKVMFNENVKDSLVKGVNLIGSAVESTFGPNANNVIIKHKGGIHITKDGATVATYVNSDNVAEQAAIDVIKEIAVKTAKDVGDGSTTSTILAKAIVNTYKDYKENPIELQRTLQESINEIIKYLEAHKKEISSLEDITKVATISANNDPKLGALIAEAFNKVGKYGVVNIGDSTQVEDSYEVTEGMQIESGYISPFFINTDNNTCELDNVYVFLSTDKLKDLKQIIPEADKAIKNKKSLLVIAPDIDTTIQRTLLLNKGSNLESCCIKSPNTGYYRDIINNDIKNILGETMYCDKVIITKDTTTFIGCHSEKDNSNIVKEIENKISNGNLSEQEFQFHSKRLANYAGGICTIKVGGFSEVEIKEKKDRVEDAICATKAALEGGVLPGGGIALLKAYNNVGIPVPTCFKAPFETLVKNSGLQVAPIVTSDFWNGYDFKNNKHGDMYELGVIDPFLVVKTALENAVSAASLLLTNECLIIKMD